MNATRARPPELTAAEHARRAEVAFRNGILWTGCSIGFGILGPVALFALARPFGGFALLTVPCELFVATYAVTLATWMLVREPSARANAIACGVFSAGVMFAAPFVWTFTWLGFSVLPDLEDHPESVLSQAILIQPLLTLVVSAVNAVRAARASDLRARAHVAVASFVLALGVPFGIWRWIEHQAPITEERILATEQPLEDLGLTKWQWLAPGHRWLRLRDEYLLLTDQDPVEQPARERRIEDAFQALTGQPILFD